MMSNRPSFLLSLCLLAAALFHAPGASSQDNERQVLNRLGGTYDGNHLLTSSFLDEAGLVIMSEQFSTGGRVIVPKRKGQRVRGSISFGLGTIDFSQRVRKVRARRKSVVYRGPLLLSSRDSDQPPFVGSFRARTKIKRNKEQLIFRFSSLIELESSGPDSPAINQLSGRFKSVR